MSSPATRATAVQTGRPGQTAGIIPFPVKAAPGGSSELASATAHTARPTAEALRPSVHIRPDGGVRRQATAWSGLAGEVVRIKLPFVRAARSYRETQYPRALGRATYLYIDPAGTLVDPDTRFDRVALAPRLFFDNQVLWETVLKLKALIEVGGSSSRLYAEALGAVLAYELMRLNEGMSLADRPARGGLAGWQRRTVTEYVEENLAEQISLTTLAGLVRLSPFHFSRAFKRSFGIPPHRYHTNRRVERAKMLLAQPARSVTSIAVELGFSEPSALTAAFHKLTGQTPNGYRRSLI